MGKRNTEKVQTLEYGSLNEWYDDAKRARDAGRDTRTYDYSFAKVHSFEDAAALCRDGWTDREADALAIAETAISEVDRDYDAPKHFAAWDVTGSAVDIGAFLAGEPENMIEYHTAPAPTTGRVVAVCASVCYSAAINAKTIERRGHIVASLAIALTTLGFNVELWADFSTRGSGGKEARQRVLVKGANDELDIARVMYAYCHPSALRVLGFANMENMRSDIRTALGFGLGTPIDPVQNLPEGTLYLPSICSSHDVPSAPDGLRDLLRQAGVLESA